MKKFCKDFGSSQKIGILEIIGSGGGYFFYPEETHLKQEFKVGDEIEFLNEKYIIVFISYETMLFKVKKII